MKKSVSLINCNKCKVRKLRCSRELPECSYCSERGILCIYSDQIRRRGVSKAGLTSFMNKIKVSSSVRSHNLISDNGENIKTPASKFILFQSILQPIDFVESSQVAVAKIQSNGTRKVQAHILLMLSTQIIDYDRELIPQIDFFLSKLELGVFGGLLKFSIHMNQEWITELFSPHLKKDV